MAADPYGDYQGNPYGDYVDQERRKAQMDAMLGSASDTSFYDRSNPKPGPVDTSPLMDQPTIYPVTETAPAPAPTGGGGGGGGAPRPAFQPPAPVYQPVYGGGGGGVGIDNATPAKAPVITDEVTALLRQRLKDLQTPMDVTTDPIFQNQVKAFNVQSQRDTERARAQLAERLGASHAIASGGFNTKVRGLQEQQGIRNQSYVANLASDRFKQREAQLNQAIAMARAVGQDDVAVQLENEKMKLAVEALRVQQELGLKDIDLRKYLGEGQLNLGGAQLGLGYDQLGFNYANLANSMNRDAVLAALGGG